jgi:dCMP deaminase
MQNKWDERFFQLAETVATWSKDKTKVGCVLISPDRTQVSYGYNGFPRGIKDDQRLTSENKNQLMVHAEINAILNAKANLVGWTLYCTKFPCIECSKAIIQSHFKRIVVKSRTGGSWADSQQLAYDLIKESKIIISEV